METFRLDADDDYEGLCGEIYLTLKKYLVFRCLLCDCKFKNGFTYLWHMTKEHGTLGSSIVNRNLKNQNLSVKPTFETVRIQDQNEDISNKMNLSHNLTEAVISIEPVEHQAKHKNVIEKKCPHLRNKYMNSQQQVKVKKSYGNMIIIEKVSQKIFPDSTLIRDKTTKPQSQQQKQLGTSSRTGEGLIQQRDPDIPPYIWSTTINPTSNLKSQQKPTTSVVSSPIAIAPDTELLVSLCETEGELTNYNDEKCSEENSSVTSTSGIEYRRHRERHQTTYECAICSEVFQYCSTYTKHLNEHDIEDKFHRCEICCKGFTTADELTIHIALHTDEERGNAARQAYKRPYKCPVCGFRMKDSANIVSHMRRHSENNKKHECPDCPKKFFTSTELKTHSRQHTGERPFLCSECGEAFTSSGLLSKHKRTQHLTRERTFECTICPSSFFEKDNLKQHMTYHQGIRKHPCSYCGVAFKRKTALNSHIKIHKNELTYKCSICEKRFNQSPALHSHMKTHKIVKQKTECAEVEAQSKMFSTLN